MQINDIHQQIKNKFPGHEIEIQGQCLLIAKSSLPALARFLKDEMNFENCHCITAIDRKDKIEVVYLFYSTPNRFMLTLKTILKPDDMAVETLSHLWKSADWLEREVFDLFGVKFLNHPDLRRILNPDTWKDFPLRKDFKQEGFIPRPQLGKVS